MSLEAKMAGHGKEEKAAVPEFLGKPTEDLWAQYVGYHEIDPVTGVNKPRQRERATKKHRDNILKGIEAIIGEEEAISTELPEGDKKQVAAEIVTHLAKHYLDSISSEAGKAKPKEDEVRLFLNNLKEVGIDVTYEDLIKEIINASQLSYNDMERYAPRLKAIIDYTAQSKTAEGKKIQLLQQTLSREYEHHGKLRELAGQTLGVEFNESANPANVFESFREHLGRKSSEYDSLRQKTYTKKKGRGEHEDNVLEFDAGKSKNNVSYKKAA